MSRPISRTDRSEAERAEAWWQGLSAPWQRAFRQAVPGLASDADTPGTEALLDLVSSTVLRLAGPRAPFPNLDFELEDLTGVAGLRSLRILSVTDMRIRSVEPLSTLTSLEELFLQDNRIESLAGIEPLAALEALYCQGNRIESLEPIRPLTRLRTLYASRNAFACIDGLHEGHLAALEQLYLLPSDALAPAEVARVQRELGVLCRQG